MLLARILTLNMIIKEYMHGYMYIYAHISYVVLVKCHYLYTCDVQHIW